MIKLGVTIEGLDGISGPGGVLDPKIFKKALVSATNKVAKKAKVAGAKEMRRLYKLPMSSAEVKAAIKIKSANYDSTTAVLWTSTKRGTPGARISLDKFGARQVKGGVSFKIKKAGGRQKFTGAFLAKMKSGHVGVFWRAKAKGGASTGFSGGQGKSGDYQVSRSGSGRVRRFQIEGQYGPGVGDLFNSEKVFDKILKTVETEGPDEFHHEYNRLLSRAKK